MFKIIAKKRKRVFIIAKEKTLSCFFKPKYLFAFKPNFFCAYAFQLIRHLHVCRLSVQNKISCWALSTQTFNSHSNQNVFVLMLFSWSDTSMCEGCQNKIKFLVELYQPKLLICIQTKMFLCWCYSVEKIPPCVKVVSRK